jgi:tripartite-type tricarboxylate transporter receptor subunit TctC
MKSSFLSFGIYSASLAALAWTGVSLPAAAQDHMSFAGKTVSMIIGFEAGGGVDLYGRMLGRHLASHLPGQPGLIVLNQLGAGGVVALNDWANKAERNGLFVTLGAQSQIDPDAVIRTRAKYDPTTLKYVGGLAAPSQALFINKDAVKRLHDKSEKPVVIGVIGTTLRTGNYQALWGAAFLGWNVRWVRGYTRTSELRQAMERGEIDMTSFGSIRDIQYLLETGQFAVVSQSGTVEGGKPVPRPVLGSTPIISELIKGKIKDPLAQQAFDYGENVSQIGFWLALPPQTADGIVATYVKAFEGTLKDPKYQAEMAKIDPDSPVASKADLEGLVRELAKVSPETLDFIQAELKRQGFGSTN